jgi:mRNA-degrading endonuclease RelE of RelBE toxin-antitoxin system
MYEVRLHRSVDKTIAKLDHAVRTRIKEELIRLKEDPLSGARPARASYETR